MIEEIVDAGPVDAGPPPIVPLTKRECALRASRWSNTEAEKLQIRAIIRNKRRGHLALAGRGMDELRVGTYVGTRCFKVTQVDTAGVTLEADPGAPLKKNELPVRRVPLRSR